jgi:hypothetical protein
MDNVQSGRKEMGGAFSGATLENAPSFFLI